MVKHHVLLGDLHGEFRFLKLLLEKREREWASVTIVGDLAIGFPGLFAPPFRPPMPVSFIRGNHDNPDFLQDLPEQWTELGWTHIKDGTIREGTLYVGGAISIDAAYRTPGFDWWPEEELSDTQWAALLDRVREHPGPIHTVITHDAPERLYPLLGIPHPLPNRTMVWLQRLFEDVLVGEKQPRNWYFGHHHQKLTVEIEGTVFRCLDTVDSGDVVTLAPPITGVKRTV